MSNSKQSEAVLARAEALRARVFGVELPPQDPASASSSSTAALSSDIGRRLVGALDLQELFGDDAFGGETGTGEHGMPGSSERIRRSLAPVLQDVPEAEELAEYILAQQALEVNPALQGKYKDQQAVYPPVIGSLLSVYATIDPSVQPPSQGEQLRTPFFPKEPTVALLEPGVTPYDRRTRTQVAKILLDAEIARGTTAPTHARSLQQAPAVSLKRMAEGEPTGAMQGAPAKRARQDKKLKKLEKKRRKEERRQEKERRHA